MAKGLVNSHDKFFKYFLSKLDNAREFVAKTLPEEITSQLDFESFELDQTEYIDSKLKTSFSDIVYNCIYSGTIRIKISLLFEHKSYKPDYPHLQLLGYMLDIWRQQKGESGKLTPIIPIIFYHGEEKWEKESFEDYFYGVDTTLEQFLPSFDYQLKDTVDYSNQQIKDLFESEELKVSVFVMKNIFNEEELIDWIPLMFSGLKDVLETEQGEEYFEAVSIYLVSNTKLDVQKISKKMKTISLNAEKKFVSTAMMLEMKGEARGKEIGKEIGKAESMNKAAYSLLKYGIPDNVILKSTGLTQEQLDFLKTLKEYNEDLLNLPKN